MRIAKNALPLLSDKNSVMQKILLKTTYGFIYVLYFIT